MALKKIKFILVFPVCLFILIFLIPIKASSEPLQRIGWISSTSQKIFANNLNESGYLNDSMGIQTINNYQNLTSNLTLNYNKENHFTVDQSFLEYKKNYKVFGIGKVSRNWSFSPNTSLILSKNARPNNSAYFKLENNQRPRNFMLSWIGPWSLETFNSIPSNSTNVKDAMLLGIRTVFEPVSNLKFELVKTSQWGGFGYNKNLSSFIAAISGNTNESKNSNINQMAGFGFSFLTNSKKIPSRFFAQIIGEDEAGSLPSCYMTLIGNEWEFLNNALIKKIGFEYIDTRIDTTYHGFCGPNTAYNNGTYDYTNYGMSLGAPIDSEGKSFNVWASTNISKNTSIKYSLKDMTINDTNWSIHRLTTSKQKGWMADVDISWKLNSFKINSKLTYQGLYLDKVNINKGLSLTFGSQYVF
jgi:hypothetical protein